MLSSIDIEELSPDENEIEKNRLFEKINYLQSKGIFPFHYYTSENIIIEFKDAT